MPYGSRTWSGIVLFWDQLSSVCRRSSLRTMLLDSDNLTIIILVIEANPPAKPDFLWTVQTYSLDMTDSNVFFLWLHPGGSSEQGDKRNVTMATHYFNITDKPTPSPSSSIPISTSTAATKPTSQSIDADNEVPNQSQQSLSTGAIAGIAVSAALGGVFGIACLIMVWMRHSRQRKQKHSPTSGLSIGPALQSNEYYSKGHDTNAELVGQWTQRHPVELSGTSTPYHHQGPVELE